MKVQDAIGLLCGKGTLLTHVQLVHQYPQILLCSAVFQLLSPQQALVRWVTASQVQDFVPSLNFTRLLSAHFSSMSRSLQMSSYPFSMGYALTEQDV